MRNKSLLVIVFAVLGLLTCVGWALAAQARSMPQAAEPIFRVGTFDRTDVLVAYYRSDIHARWLHELQRRRDAARAAGNAEQAREIEALGGESQEEAHRQLAGEAPLTNVIEHLQPHWPAIAADAQVALIVEKPLYTDDAVQIVDVTEQIVDRLSPEHPHKDPSKPGT